MKKAGSIPFHFLVLLAVFAAASQPVAADPASSPAGKTTVVWISMDGFRGDYLDRTGLPFFTRLTKEGFYSRRFHPVFPTITFPSHCSEATGVAVEHHGITGNSFYDTLTRLSYNFPGDASLLQAEPIWLTAERQGVRTLVFDWPLSQKQPAALHDDYFSDKFDNAPTDAQRLDHLLDVWKHDFDDGKANGPGGPLRLLMGYVEGTDPVGHRFGPDAPEIAVELQSLDQTVGKFAERALDLWKQHASPADRFYLLLTTDHGMSKVDHDVNLERMLDLPHGQQEITLETVGNLANVFLDQLPAGPVRVARMTALLEKLKAYPFARVYPRADLPPAWGYGHPTRTGDIVIVLPRGYTFNRAAATPIADADQTAGPKGMHGYPVEDDPEMYGVMFLSRYPQAFGGKDLGEVMWDQYHPTVAKLLGIQPADDAKGKPIPLPRE